MAVKVKLKNPGLVAAAFRSMAQLRGTTLRQELRRNAGIITFYCAKMIPPTTGTSNNKGAISQSWQAQQRAGKKAIKRDVAKVFQPLRSLGLLKNVQWAAAVNKMIRKRDLEALQKFLEEKGVHQTVIVEATVELHNQFRNRRGRAKKSGGPFLVIESGSIKKVRDHQISHLGQAKAGYNAALRSLSREQPPDWVSRHATPGSVQDRTSNFLRPSIRVENNVKYGGSFDPLQIAEKAIEVREKTAAREIREILRTKLKQGMRSTGLGK